MLERFDALGQLGLFWLGTDGEPGVCEPCGDTGRLDDVGPAAFGDFGFGRFDAGDLAFAYAEHLGALRLI